MTFALYSISVFLIVLSLLPFVKNQHWIFRVAEFIKIQLLFLQIVFLGLNIAFLPKDGWFWLINIIQLTLIIYHLYILLRYTTIYRKDRDQLRKGSEQIIRVISSNVFQFNKEYSKFHELIRKYSPDIFITMESNADWEKANQILESDYPYTQKMTLENTYGMHLYSKIPLEKAQFHFFVAKDVPSVEVHLKTREGNFVLYGVHPPPPSPTEERTSKERDGDLLALAKRIRKKNKNTLVIGDFNTVAWSDTSILFRKTSELLDARVGRGILATFHAKYWFFRVPLDLLFHSPAIHIEKLETLEDIGSDHFPILCEFYLNPHNTAQAEDVKTLEKGEETEVERLIEEGKKEVSDNREDIP